MLFHALLSGNHQPPHAVNHYAEDISSILYTTSAILTNRKLRSPDSSPGAHCCRRASKQSAIGRERQESEFATEFFPNPFVFEAGVDGQRGGLPRETL